MSYYEGKWGLIIDSECTTKNGKLSENGCIPIWCFEQRRSVRTLLRAHKNCLREPIASCCKVLWQTEIVSAKTNDNLAKYLENTCKYDLVYKSHVKIIVIDTFFPTLGYVLVASVQITSKSKRKQVQEQLAAYVVVLGVFFL